MADAAPPNQPNANPEDPEIVENNLSDEDRELKEVLELRIVNLLGQSTAVHELALQEIAALIKESTTSLTAVPKPLKFLKEHITILKTVHGELTTEYTKKMCADIISIVSMITVDRKADLLTYKLLGMNGDINEWGHEYVRSLTVEIIERWEKTNNEVKTQLLDLAKKIVPYYLSTNSEIEACDLVMELEKLELLESSCKMDSYLKVCSYLVQCSSFMPQPEDTKLLYAVFNIYMKFNDYALALRTAMKLQNHSLITTLMKNCLDSSVKKQLAFMIARQQIALPNAKSFGDEDIQNILQNTNLKKNFVHLCKELDILQPKAPHEIYKIDSAIDPALETSRKNMGHSLVSGFVNAGFGTDEFLSKGGLDSDGRFFSDIGSLGLVHLWDAAEGKKQLSRYLDSNEPNEKAGALLALGIINCGLKNDEKPFPENLIKHPNQKVKVGAILGLGLAHAGTNNLEVMKQLCSIVEDDSVTLELASISCVSCGLIGVGNGSLVISEHAAAATFCKALTKCTKSNLKKPRAIYMALSLGLLYLGKQTAVYSVIGFLNAVPEPFKSISLTLLEACAYAGTGNLTMIQKMLHICSENPKETENITPSGQNSVQIAKNVDFSLRHSVAVIGIALIAMGEETGTEMALRSFSNLLRYGELCVKRAVPLALAILSVSNPRMDIQDTLNRCLNENDRDTVINATFALGIIGAGTNNAKVAATLRQLAGDFENSPKYLFITRVAQGLLYLGKGALSLAPFHSDRQILNPTALAGLLSTLFSFLHVDGNIFGNDPFMLFCLTTAIHPRMLLTLDENLQPLKVHVRVGKAVDTTGVVGRPRTITGFQLYTTPVLLDHNERAELVTDQYIPLSPVLEGIIVLKRNPDAQDEQ